MFFVTVIGKNQDSSTTEVIRRSSLGKEFECFPSTTDDFANAGCQLVISDRKVSLQYFEMVTTSSSLRPEKLPLNETSTPGLPVEIP